MDAQRVTITIDDDGDDNFNMSGPISKRKSDIGGSVDAVDPLANEEFNRSMEAVAALHGESLKIRRTVKVGQRHSQPLICSPMPTLPYPPKHKINNAFKKTPPIPKLTVCTKPGTVILTWIDGIGTGSYHLYAPIAGHELFACILDGGVDNAKWEKLTYILALPPSHNRQAPVKCEMTKMTEGVEYYFAVRAVDIHDRRGPCAVVYARL